MRFLMFEHGSGRRLGVLAEGRSDTVVDLAELAAASGSTPPPADLMALIDAGDAGMASVKHLVAKLKPSAGAPILRPLASLTLLAPLGSSTRECHRDRPQLRQARGRDGRQG